MKLKIDDGVLYNIQVGDFFKLLDYEEEFPRGVPYEGPFLDRGSIIKVTALFSPLVKIIYGVQD